MKPHSQSTILMVGDNPLFAYLIERYAAHMGCSIQVVLPDGEAESLCSSQTLAVIFPSVEALEAAQSLVGELANCEIPILVCSSLIDQLRARDLGADYCLLHPLRYDDFRAAITHATASKHA